MTDAPITGSTSHKLAEAAIKIERLVLALQRIDGINDNPACYNPMIEEVLRAVLGPKCDHGFSTRADCPTCQHFDKVRKSEDENLHPA